MTLTERQREALAILVRDGEQPSQRLGSITLSLERSGLIQRRFTGHVTKWSITTAGIESLR